MICYMFRLVRTVNMSAMFTASTVLTNPKAKSLVPLTKHVYYVIQRLK